MFLKNKNLSGIILIAPGFKCLQFNSGFLLHIKFIKISCAHVNSLKIYSMLFNLIKLKYVALHLSSNSYHSFS